MSPITASTRRVALYLAWWLAMGCALAGALVVMGASDWPRGLGFALPVAVALGFILASSYYLCLAMELGQRNGLQTLLVFGVASAIAGGVWALMGVAWNSLGASAVGGNTSASELVAIPPQFWVAASLLGAGLYLIALLMHDVWIASDRMRQLQSRQAHLQLLAREAQLQALRTQINPHFLFNSLNSISALTTLNPAAARAMTLELAAFFRQTLLLAEQAHIALQDEIVLCEHFLAVEKIRYGESLRTQVDVAEQAREIRIPPMLLQPCIENAVKHGVRSTTGGGCVSLTAIVQGAWLYVTIENPMEPDEEPQPQTDGTGTGLVNIRRRLDTVYGDRARLTTYKKADRFVLELVLPTEISL
jgi:two-component system, LytTR family, sensor histidine kinase AlgZ